MVKTPPTTPIVKDSVRYLSYDYQNFPHKDTITFAQYRLIVTTFYMTFMESVITEGHIYKLPKGNGFFGVLKKKTNNEGTDYQHFKETGEVIKHMNLHTSRYRCCITWLKSLPFRELGMSPYINNMIQFKTCRYFTRRLASKLKTELNINIFRDRDDYKIR